jgi:hypothetical protein
VNYEQLIGTTSTPGSLSRWINYSQIVNDAPEIVLEAESWIYRRLRHWQMLTPPVYGTFTINVDYIDNPPDMLEPFLLWTSQLYFQFMPMKTPQEVIANWSYDGSGNRVQQQPMMYYMDQAALRFDSPPDQAYNYNLIYFQQPAALATLPSPGANFLTNTYPRLMRCACMAAACEFAKDAGQGNYDRTYWDQMAQDEIEKAQAESDRAKRATVAGAVLIGGGVSSNFPMYVNGY